MLISEKPILTPNRQLFILVLLAAGLNVNTLFNNYVYDDKIVFTGNKLVKKGIRGIPEILTRDLFYGIYEENINLSGGRYRPLTLVVFSLEYHFFGKDPFVSHLINLVLFALLTGLLFRLLHKHVFKEQHPLLAFVTCLIFVVHPVHTEVIANVKSRDELIAMIFLVLASFSFIRYHAARSWKAGFSGLFFYFLALMTKESAIPYIGVLALAGYFFFNRTVKKALLDTLPLIAVLALYLAIRAWVLGFSKSQDMYIVNFPFLYATAGEAFATKVFLLARYIGLLFFPHPLTFDYGYNDIPYVGLSSLEFIVSCPVILGLLAYSVAAFRKRILYSFCILYFFATIFLFANFIMNIGAFMAERLLFQPSLGFCIAAGAFFLHSRSRRPLLSTALLAIMLILFSVKTVIRNGEWKNGDTLFLTDVITSPNSVRANHNAAIQYMIKAEAETDENLKKGFYRKVIYFDEKTVSMVNEEISAYINLGDAYLATSDYFRSADNFLLAFRADPSRPYVKNKMNILSDILYSEGNRNYRQGAYDEAIRCYLRSLDLNEMNADAWHNLGRTFFKVNDSKKGYEAWQRVLKIDPSYTLKF